MATLAWAFSTLSFRPENLLKNILSQSARTKRNATKRLGRMERWNPPKNWGIPGVKCEEGVRKEYGNGFQFESIYECVHLLICRM